MRSDTTRSEVDEITILVVDDHPLLRQALRNVLERESDFKVIGEAEDGQQAVSLATDLNPRVVIMDVSMPVMSGIEAILQIKVKHPDIAVLVLSVYDDNEHILSLLEAGASGYLTKRVFGHEVIQAVRVVAAGEVALSSQVTRQLISHALRYAVKPAPAVVHDGVTSRELQILRMAARGLTNKDIALKLGLTASTVKSYLADIFTKLHVSSRTSAVISALRAGILSNEDIG